MSRFVEGPKSGIVAGESDGFATRLTKYFPTEIMVLYTMTIGGLVSSAPDPQKAPWIAVGLIAVFCLATILYFAKAAPDEQVRKAHMVASPIAFLAWAYPLAAPLLGHWFVGYISILAQGIAALAAFLIVPKDPAASRSPALAVPATPTPGTP